MKTILPLFVVFAITGLISTQFLECNNDVDCVAEGSKCEEEVCKCPKGLVYSLDGNACLPVKTSMQADCTDEKQCGWLLGKHQCDSGKCECANGWRYWKGRCVKYAVLGETCATDFDCFTNHDIISTKCGTEHTCVCNAGYYQRGNYDCRPESTINEYCSLNSDCKTENTKCIGSICKIPERRSVTETIIYKKRNSTNIQVSVQHREPTIECNSHGDCAALVNSICYPLTGKCVCKRGYFYNSENECIPELGTSNACKINADCKIDLALCTNGKCTCPKTYYYVSNRSCQKPMTHDNHFCNNKERCFVMGLQATCDKDTNKCQCEKNTKLDDDYICRPAGYAGPGSCNNNQDCIHYIKNSICVQEKCQCPERYRLENKVCLPNIGGVCDDAARPCALENTECLDEQCACKEGYVADGERTCLRETEGLEQECKINSQCSTVVPNSECIKEKCKCVEGHIVKNRTCILHLRMGGECTSLRQCTDMLSDSVKCWNGRCQCSPDMRVSEDRKSCEPSSSPENIPSINTVFLLLGLIFLHNF